MKIRATVTIRDILCGIKKHGELTTYVEFNPAVPTRASRGIFRFSRADIGSIVDVERKNLRIGDMIIVACDTRTLTASIEEAHRRTKMLSPWQPPTLCPFCGGELKFDDGRIYCKTYFETGTH